MNPASHRNGRGGVETDKLHAMIHFIVCRIKVLVKTPLVYGSKEVVFTQINTAPFPLRHNSCEGCIVLVVTCTTSARRYRVVPRRHRGHLVSIPLSLRIICVTVDSINSVLHIVESCWQVFTLAFSKSLVTRSDLLHRKFWQSSFSHVNGRLDALCQRICPTRSTLSLVFRRCHCSRITPVNP